ncbi:spore coat U domain-containing protein [Psychrobacter frigidicola]|uniref:Spore coat U domain-containing protein n=1 Tax=Psychrobacter frigidicola TaxID=45611 RepID=A0A5C7A326_9GAMM|nr:spore coat protein U domain-containing protein [Psychrobacter frigidicola]TXD97789.1 spore coat U domain-containing protein [Psychrobacter frigidicola]
MIKLFDMTVFHYGYRLLLLPIIFCIALWLTPTNAQAILNVTCTANMSNVNLGSIIPENSESANITGTLSYSCDNAGDTAGYISVCLAANGGADDPDGISPRKMISPSGKDELEFNMRLSSSNGEIWGDRDEGGNEYSSEPIYILAGQKNVTGQETIFISLISGKRNRQATQGIHTNKLTGKNTALTVYTSTVPFKDGCLGIAQGKTRFPFIVQATVTAGCFISATSDINLGSYSAGATNIAGSNNAVSVTCQKDVSYNIGLSPSNGNKYGAGVMTSKISNPDRIPYQLQSDASGKVWGNDGTTYATLTNGVTGKGNGDAQAHTVYVTVPSADVRPDSYSDIVTISVNY